MVRGKSLLVFLIVAVFVVFSGCSKSNNIPADSGRETQQFQEGNEESDTKQGNLVKGESAQEDVDLAQIKANEAGKVMILMYHVIGSDKEGDWSQTSENFRRDLQMLYDQGYSLISLNDFLANNITAPAGKTPLVLTFDDGTEGHFRYLVDGKGNKEIDPDCAVGILLNFAQEHPEFGHTATFYVNSAPFRQKDYFREKLNKLVELGFDIGNHTLTHEYLNKVSDDKVQKELGGLAKYVADNVPEYQVTTLALPFGLSPKNYSLAVKGSYNDFTYEHKGILKVGARPALSPIREDFDPYRLPRVKASTEELGKWLEYFKNHPEERYISDGNPNKIAVPHDKEQLVDKSKMKDKELVSW